ncbi:hypothetical protein HASA104033_00005 [Halobacterium salinarum]
MVSLSTAAKFVHVNRSVSTPVSFPSCSTIRDARRTSVTDISRPTRALAPGTAALNVSAENPAEVSPASNAVETRSNATDPLPSPSG